MLMYSNNDLILVGYTDSEFMSGKDFKKSTFSYLFMLGNRAMS